MAQSFSIEGVLSLQDKGFSNALKNAASSLDNLASKAKSSMQSSAGDVNSFANGLKVSGAAITALGVTSLKSFGSFEASLNKAAVVAGGTSKDIKGLADEANKMGAELPLSAQDAADAMVAMAQDGASIGTIKEEFPAIAKAATAAGSDLQTTASVVQQSMNIWGKSLESPAQAASILTQTANMSNASIEDMQQALATIGGTATNAGISMQDTSTAIGLLTNKGFSAAQASQDLNHALLQIQAPSKVAQKEMTALGISYTDAEGNMKSFPTILGEINTALEGMKPAEKAKAMKALFGTAGMGAMLPLLDSIKDKSGSTTTSWEAFSDSLQKNAGSNTAALKSLDDQAAEMQKNLGSKIEQVGGNWESLRNSAMQASSGINGSILDMINNLLNMGANSDTAFGKIAQGFVGFSTIIGPAMTATGALVGSFNQLVTGSSNLGKALKALASPQMAIIAGLALLATGFMLAYKNSEPFRNAVDSIVSSLQSGFNSALRLAQDVLGKFGIHIQSTSDLMTALTGALKSPIAGFAAMGAGAVLLLGTFGGLTGPISLVKNLFGSLGGIFAKLLPSFGSTGDKVAEMTGKLTQSGGSARQASSMFSGFSGAVLKIGTAVGIAAAGLGVFAFGIAEIAKQGDSGVEAISGVSVGISMIIGVLAACSPLFTANVAGLEAFGNAALKVGASIAIASAGITILVLAITRLAGTGQAGVTAVTAIAVAIGALAAVFALLGPKLTASVVGIVGFGAAVALIGVGIGVASAGIAALVTAFTGLIAVTSQIVPALTAVGTGFTIMMTTILMGVITNVGLITTAFVAMGTAILTSVITLTPLLTQAFIAIGTGILTAITTLLPQVITLIQNTIIQILAALTAIIPQFITFIDTLITALVTEIVALSPMLIDAGLTILQNLLNGISSHIEEITTVALEIIVKFVNTIASNLGQVIDAAVNLVVAFIEGISNNLGKVIAAAVDLIGKFVLGLVQAIPQILSYGVQAVEKFVEGVGEVIGQMQGEGLKLITLFVKGIISGIAKSLGAGKKNANAVKNGVSGINLFNQGEKIINGFLNGLQSAYKGVQSFVSGIAGWIKSHKGPIQYDRKLLIPAGNAIMNVLNGGLNDGFSDVKSNVAGMADKISSLMTTGVNDFDIGGAINSANKQMQGELQSNITNEMSLTTQPANINLQMGNNVYSAFVDDVTKQQSTATSLRIDRRF